VVLAGNAGTAKTELLARLAARGVQVIDLEGLARHRGSLFGAMPGGQPSQKGFESALALALARLDPERPVVVEAESSKIGDLRLPPKLWRAMVAAPRVAVAAPVDARAAYLVRAYRDLLDDPARLAAVIDQLRPQHAAGVVDGWQALAAAGEFATLAEQLMVQHYDPRYGRHNGRMAGVAVEVASASLEPQALERLADRVATEVAGLCP